MKLDNEQQRKILIQLIDSATFPGHAREMVTELGRAIAGADIEEPISVEPVSKDSHANGLQH